MLVFKNKEYKSLDEVPLIKLNTFVKTGSDNGFFPYFYVKGGKIRPLTKEVAELELECRTAQS